jgi:amidase
VGLKPSRGRVSAGPDLGDSFLSVNGALTRTVAESAAMLDLLAGYEVGDATWAPPPAEPFAVTAARPPERRRIAFTTASPLQTPVDPAASLAVLDAAKLLESLGHIVEEVAPPEWQAGGEQMPFFMVLWGAGIAGTIRWGARVTGRAPSPEMVEPLSWMFYEQGTSLSAADYLGAMTVLQGHARKLIGFFQTYDALLTPTLAQRPLRIGELDTCGENPLAEFQKAAVFTPFTAIFNVSGQPAISLPLYQGADGLPLAVQLVGPPLGEGLLLRLATQLEAALPWADRQPTRQ